MSDHRFDALVARLEQTAKAHPRRYLAWVMMVALLGFVILAAAVLLAIIPAVLLIALLFFVVSSGGAFLLLLLKLGKLFVLLVFPAWMMVKSAFQMLFSRFPRPQGRILTESEAPALFARINELQQRMNGPRIHRVLLTDELNAAIVQYARLGLLGFHENYLILGFPLLQIMSEDEALAVVAHEYGHLSGHHSRLSGFIYRLRETWRQIQAISAQWESWMARWIARVFNWYAPYFNAYTFVLARQNEYAADCASTEMAGARNTANALMRTNIATQFENEVFWPSIHRMIADIAQPLENRSHYWVGTIRERLDDSMRVRYLGIAQNWQTDYLDTHPSIRDRLLAIDIEINEDDARELMPPALSAAEIWLGANLRTLQHEFDQNWQSSMAERWQAQHSYLKECRERLAALQAQSDLNPEEHWELIRCTKELTPEFDVLPLLNALLQLDPDHASARYLRGECLLAQGDEAGIADLERCMELDVSTTLSACEKAWQFYLVRNPALAAQYYQRGQARLELEQRVMTELQSLPSNATLAVHNLDRDTEDKIRNIVQTNGKYVRRAYLLRRILKSDPTRHDYVLAFETKYFTFGSKSGEVIKKLTQQIFPCDTFIIHLENSTYKHFRKDIKRLHIAPLYEK